LAEDAKDIYYEQEKKRIRGHEIIRVNWADDFKKAVVVTVIQTEVVMRVVTPAGAGVVALAAGRGQVGAVLRHAGREADAVWADEGGSEPDQGVESGGDAEEPGG
jgi:hypothetical protein